MKSSHIELPFGFFAQRDLLGNLTHSIRSAHIACCCSHRSRLDSVSCRKRNFFLIFSRMQNHASNYSPTTNERRGDERAKKKYLHTRGIFMIVNLLDCLTLILSNHDDKLVSCSSCVYLLAWAHSASLSRSGHWTVLCESITWYRTLGGKIISIFTPLERLFTMSCAFAYQRKFIVWKTK